MLSWMDTYQSAREEITEARQNSLAPLYSIQAHDHVLNVASDVLKRAFTLYQENLTESEAAKATAEKSHSRNARKISKATYLKLLSVRDTLKEIFWIECVQRFPELIGKQYIAIRHRLDSCVVRAKRAKNLTSLR